jgi:ribosome-associated toxin RatA of RatAB toxin-antitoxin module
LLCTLALLVATSAGARDKGVRYDRRQVALLNHGDVVTKYWKLPGGKIGTGWAAGVIDASPEEVFAVVGAVERYPEFFERLAVAKIKRRLTPTTYDFYYRIDMPWPLSDHWCISRNTHEIDKKRRQYRRRWRLLKGTFHHNRGSWTVRPWGKGKALLHYTVVLKPIMSAPDFVLNYASEVALPRSVKAIRKRVKALKK